VALVAALALVAASAATTVTVVVLHLGFRPVLTGSMEPTYGPGAMLLTERVPVRSLRPGMIVLFVPPGEHAEYAHRITSVSGPASTPVITTKGDANPAADPWHARIKAQSVQEVVFGVPWLGNAMVAMHGDGLRILLIVTAGLFVAITGAQAILRSPRHRASAPA